MIREDKRSRMTAPMKKEGRKEKKQRVTLISFYLFSCVRSYNRLRSSSLATRTDDIRGNNQYNFAFYCDCFRPSFEMP